MFLHFGRLRPVVQRCIVFPVGHPVLSRNTSSYLNCYLWCSSLLLDARITSSKGILQILPAALMVWYGMGGLGTAPAAPAMPHGAAASDVMVFVRVKPLGLQGSMRPCLKLEVAFNLHELQKRVQTPNGKRRSSA